MTDVLLLSYAVPHANVNSLKVVFCTPTVLSFICSCTASFHTVLEMGHLLFFA